jgi:hypothetical protein
MGLKPRDPTNMPEEIDAFAKARAHFHAAREEWEQEADKLGWPIPWRQTDCVMAFVPEPLDERWERVFNVAYTFFEARQKAVVALLEGSKTVEEISQLLAIDIPTVDAIRAGDEAPEFPDDTPPPEPVDRLWLEKGWKR